VRTARTTRPPAHKVEVVTGDRDNTGVYTEENQIGSPDHYVVNHDVWQLPGQGK